MIYKTIDRSNKRTSDTAFNLSDEGVCFENASPGPTCIKRRAGDGRVVVEVDGTEALEVDTNVVQSNVVTQGPNGAVSGPSYSFTNSTDSGIYYTPVALGEEVRLAVSGNDIASFCQGNVNAVSLNNQNGEQLILSDAGSGVQLYAGGILRFNVDTLKAAHTVPIRCADGSTSAPSFSFTNSTNSGQSWSGTAVEISVNGNLALSAEDQTSNLAFTDSELFAEYLVDDLTTETVNSYNLTNNNTVTLVASQDDSEVVQYNVASFDPASNQYLSRDISSETIFKNICNTGGSISMWVYPDSTVDPQAALHLCRDTTAPLIAYNNEHLWVHYNVTSDVMFLTVINDVGTTIIDCHVPVPTGSWSMVTYVFQSGSNQVYVNGQLQVPTYLVGNSTTGTSSISFTTLNRLYIGGIESPNAETWEGEMNTVMFTEREYTASEVFSLYNQQASRFSVNAGTVGIYEHQTVFSSPAILPSYTLATLPKAQKGSVVYIPDGAGGRSLAVSDGEAWGAIAITF